MDPKLTLLFVLIGSIIALSNINDGTFSRIGRQLFARNWRSLMARRRG
jgi:hypothetical protein